MFRGLRFSCIVVVASFFIGVASAQTVAPNTYFFPQTAAGTAGDLTILTQFSIYNPTQSSGQIEMAFFKRWVGEALTLHISSPDDETLTSDGSSLSFKLGAGTKYVINLSLNGDVQVGWTKVLSDVPLQISATYGTYQRLQSGEIGAGRYVALWEAGVLPAEPSHEVSFPVHRVDNELVQALIRTPAMGLPIFQSGGVQT